jgi:branched-chain amino acid transport system permease protein
VELSVIAQAAGGGDKFLSAVATGLSIGAIYAMLALGFVILFKATQVVNFAHGAIAALGAFFVAYFAVTLNFPGRFVGFLPDNIVWGVNVVTAVAVTAGVGMLFERLTIRPMIGEPLFSVAMVTIGLDIIVRTFTNDAIGQVSRPMGDPFGVKTVELGPVTMAQAEIATIVVTMVVLALVAWFFRSRMGIAMRAVAFDQEAAMAQGISVGRIFAIAWAIGAALAAIGGLFASVFPRANGVGPATAFVAFRAFPAVIVGGLDSIIGAVAGGFIIGLAESFAASYLFGETWSFLGVGFNGVVAWVVMLVVLFVRPYGLFGTAEIRRV